MERQDILPVTPAEETPTATAATHASPPRKRLFLVRHGQTTYNVEGRLPGQLSGVGLTDEGRRQAHRCAVAFSGSPLTAVVSSPLERARETAEIIARGWGVTVQFDGRLVDTDVGHWAGQKIGDLEKSDPQWKAFVQHPSEPPPGIESMPSVMERAVAAVEHIRRSPAVGDTVALVAHADVVKLIVAHYLGVHPDAARFIHIDNASITTLVFQGDEPAVVLALNWTASPFWLCPPPPKGPEPVEQGPAGAEIEASAPRDTTEGAGGAS